MATQLPAKLKSADIHRFALRASQLETAKPAIAYWCEYWIVNQLLAKGLHNTDAECLHYTSTLMDKLEQTKARYANDDAIVDDTVGQVYVELFGLETFERADRAVRANKVTKQTIDTFLAAATFLELLNIWGEPEPEIHAKIRYAKWNAVRIVKALKEGKDPNQSNPKPVPATAEENLQPLDPQDPEVQQLGGQSTKSRQASVEEVVDEQDRIESSLAAQSTLDTSLHPSAQPTAHGSSGQSDYDSYPLPVFPQSGSDREVSPMDSTEPTSHDRTGSMGSGQFPEIPTFAADSRPPTFPTAPPDDIIGTSILGPDLPGPSSLLPGHKAPGNHDSSLLPKYGNEWQAQNFYRPPPPPQSPIYRQLLPPTFHPTPAQAPIQPLRQQTYIADDIAIAKAQKHARWAISALNFEDMNTAVKELKEALQTLGAS